MIVEGILSIVFMHLEFVLGLLPFSDISFDPSVLQPGIDIIKSVAFFLPMNTVATILGLILSIMLFRIVVALVKTIWQLLPLV